MYAYANPHDSQSRGGGYSTAAFNKKNRTITFNSWAADADVASGDKPFKGWPKTIKQWDNDGRKVVGNLGKITVKGIKNPVIQVIAESTGEIPLHHPNPRQHIHTSRLRQGNIRREHRQSETRSEKPQGVSHRR